MIEEIVKIDRHKKNISWGFHNMNRFIFKYASLYKLDENSPEDITLVSKAHKKYLLKYGIITND